MYSASIPENPVLELSRATDGPFVTALGAATAGGYSSAIALASVYSALLSLVIGLAVLAAVFLYYSSLMKKKRIKVNRRTLANWKRLFIIIGILVLIYVIATYFVASSANKSATASSFLAAYKSSNSLVIALNGTVTQQMSACANGTEAGATAMNKQTTVLHFNNNACVGAGSGFSSVDQCMSKYASKGIPVIVIGTSANNTAEVYSFYGTRLTYTGDSSYMNLCIPALFTR